MRRAEGRTAAHGVLVLAAAGAALGWGATSANAIDDAAPTEPASFVLPGTLYTSLTSDLDGDSSREVLRIVQYDGGAARVDAWTFGSGGWAEVGSQALVADDEGVSAPVDLTRGAAALMTWWVDGDERVLAFAAHADMARSFPEQLNLSVSEVTMEEGRLGLQPLSVPGGVSAMDIHAVDVDGDGTDELMLTDWQQDGSHRSELLSWTGDAFELRLEHEGAPSSSGPWVGDADGQPGEEIYFGPGGDGHLERLVWAGGELVSQTAEIAFSQPFDGWVAGATDDAIVLVASSGVRVLSWPHGEQATEVAQIHSVQYPNVHILGHGPGALVAVFDGAGVFEGDAPDVDLYDLGLRPVGTVPSSPAAAALSTIAGGNVQPIFAIDRPLFPYVGMLPDGWVDGRPSLAVNGVLIQPAAGGGFETHDISTMAGVQPIGLAGPDSGWIGLTDGWSSVVPRRAYIAWGGMPLDARLMLVPIDRLLGADGAGIASVEVVGAVETGDAADGVQPLVADGDGFELLVDAPVGSRVMLANSWRSQEAVVTEVPLPMEVVAPRSSQRERNQPLSVTVIVATPEGRVSTMQWEGLYIREPPVLEVSGVTQPFAFQARIAGRASPGTSVTVNGASIETDGDGAFTRAVNAPIWPSAVVVAARDPLGNETTQRVEVVGFVDYRGWPWIGFVVVATLVAGVALFLRVPRSRPEAARTPLEGDARLEEIEL
jgi:hypothetical protein